VAWRGAGSGRGIVGDAQALPGRIAKNLAGEQDGRQCQKQGAAVGNAALIRIAMPSLAVGLWSLARQRSTHSAHRKRLIGWLVAVQGPKDPMPRLYAAVAERRRKAYPALEHENAEALVGDHLSVTNERVEFQRRLTDGEIARLGLKTGEVKRFEIMGQANPSLSSR
jgi:hypothetical protein